ncbi:MAG: hypothetical protein GY851_32245 [bacterium]|nr:hypothetical protein [bacterium]
MTETFQYLARLATFVLVLAAAATAGACTVPVHQWAIEQWEPDLYILYVFHRGDIPADLTRALAEAGETASLDAEGPRCNLRVTLVDLDLELPDRAAAVWGLQENAEAPWAVLAFPETSPPFGPVWSGPANAESIKQAVRSPGRDAVADAYEAGATAVWVLLEGPDDEANRLAEHTLTEETARIAEALTAEPPILEDEGESAGEAQGSEVPATRVFSFPVVRVRRSDPDEAVLVKMLLSSEPDLVQYDAPMAFAIYGRGRALYALVDKGINRATIEDACRFLVGSCSCVVKEDNPGMDLLMPADWTAIAERQPDVEMAETEKAPPPLPEDALPPEPGSPLPYVVGVLVVLLSGLTVATLVMRKRAAE